MKNFNSRFAKIRSKIRKGDSETAIALLNEFQEDIAENMKINQNTIKMHVETIQEYRYGASNPVYTDNRFLEVVPAEGTTHRLTINAKQGRFTLKIANGASDTVQEDLVGLVRFIMEQAYDIPNKPLRGKIYWDKYIKGYKCILQPESKSFNYFISKVGDKISFGETDKTKTIRRENG